MADEPTVLVEEVETAEDVSEPEQESVAEEEATEETEDAPEEEIEEIEYDFGGNKLRVPKGSIPEELAAKIEDFTKGTWADYTRKSQTVAEQAKALETRLGAVEKLEGLQGKVLDTYSKGLQIRSELEQLSAVDMTALWQSDPDQARRISDMAAQKQAEFHRIVAEVNQQENELARTKQTETTRLAEEGKKAILKRVPDFEKHLPDVIEYAAKSYGVPKEYAEKAWPLNTVAAEKMYKAMMWDRMQAKAKAKPQPAQAQAVVPMKPAGNRSRAKLDLVKDADKMSPEQWVKEYRQKYGK